jgi:flagellar hook-basal body complex protein FliE
MAMAVEAMTQAASSGLVRFGDTHSTFPPARAEQADGAPFSGLLADVVGETGRLQEQADAAVTGLMTGSGVDVHTAMIATEKASMAFELTLAVRNKAVQAYQQVMGMQF